MAAPQVVATLAALRDGDRGFSCDECGGVASVEVDLGGGVLFRPSRRLVDFMMSRLALTASCLASGHDEDEEDAGEGDGLRGGGGGTYSNSSPSSASEARVSAVSISRSVMSRPAACKRLALNATLYVSRLKIRIKSIYYQYMSHLKISIDSLCDNYHLRFK